MRKTVFIVGAGASTDYGFGVGSQLATAIRNLLQSRLTEDVSTLNLDSPFDFAIHHIDASPRELISASDTIRRGLPYSNSIDDFLHENRENKLAVQLGKLSIAHCILEQERASGWLKQLSHRTIEARMQAVDQLKGTWLDTLFRLLKRGKSRSDARRVLESCSFIVFNYDRCIEQFLHSAIGDALDLDKDEARSVFQAVDIEHVYGSLGPLPAQSPDGPAFWC